MSNSGVYRSTREAVRVKVKKFEHSLNPECRKFSIDPQITSFVDLQSIIAKAFDIKGDFIMRYKIVNEFSQEIVLPLLSDTDLEAAVLRASDSTDPCLVLQVEVKSNNEKPENWQSVKVISEQHSLSSPLHKNVFGTIEIPRNQSVEIKFQKKLPGLIMNRMEKTLNIFQKAFNLGEEQISNSSVQSSARAPLSEADYKKFLDQRGQINHMKEFRLAIYYGGVEPSFRKVVWKHILNVYPQGMTAKERMDYMKKKSNEYELLRNTWRDLLQKGQMNEELNYITSMVKKDVLRTDRHHKFYAGSDDNQNIASLFNILTTYALNHPSVSYCQGMSDLASPLLVTMGDEAQAYICFCALMSRLKPNFMLDGITMTLKFQHLTEGLTYYDPEFYAYLKLHQAEDLLFCYRWLLLEMKREFAFDDALHMLEVLWSSMPAVPPEKELPLYEIKFSPNPTGLTPPPFSPLLKTTRESHFAKVCALRRQSSLMSLNSKRVLPGTNRLNGRTMDETILVRQNQSLDETILARQNQIRKHRNVKPFSSLDDNCVHFLTTIPMSGSRPISPLSVRPDSDVLTFMKKRANTMRSSAKKGGLSSSTGNLMETCNKKKFHKRLVENKSLNSLSETSVDENDSLKTNRGHKGKIVKNLNEFLNLTSAARSRVSSERYVKSPNSSISDGDGFRTEITSPKSSTDEIEVNAVHSDVENVSQLQVSTSSSCASSASPHIFENYASEVSSPDDSNEYCPTTKTSMAKQLEFEFDNLDRKLFGSSFTQANPLLSPKLDVPGTAKSECNVESEILIWENPLKYVRTPDEQTELEFDENLMGDKAGEIEEMILNPSGSFGYTQAEHNPQEMVCEVRGNKTNENGLTNGCVEAAESTNLVTRSANSIRVSGLLNTLRSSAAVTQILRSPAKAQSNVQLPKPEVFGGGNPFLMFLCLTLLRQHRDYIIQSAMDYNEMAMHFDKMVRKHNVTKVLDEARQLFSSYLKQHSIYEEKV